MVRNRCRKMLFALVFLFLIYQTSLAWHTDTWPPKVLRDLYNVPEVLNNFHSQCNSSYALIQEFELSKDLQNIPNSKEVKCYLYTAYVFFGYIKPNSPRFLFHDLMELMSEITDDEAKRIAKLFAGCEKRAKRSKDPIEMVYIFNACAKQNANEDYYFYY